MGFMANRFTYVWCWSVGAVRSSSWPGDACFCDTPSGCWGDNEELYFNIKGFYMSRHWSRNI